MTTVLSVMDRDEHGPWMGRTDVIVVVDPPARTLTWVPRDLWSEGAGCRLCAVYRQTSHAGLIGALAEHGLAVDHSVCLSRTASEAVLRDLRVTVPVERPMAFWYPTRHDRDTEEACKRVTFRPPEEWLRGERIHQWLGARHGAPPPPDLDRIRRQQAFVMALLEQGDEWQQGIEEVGPVSISSPAAIDDLRAVSPAWRMETFGRLVNAERLGQIVLVPAAD